MSAATDQTATRKSIEEHLMLDPEDLYSIMGTYFAEDGTLFSPEGQIESGKRGFQKIRPVLERRLCTEWQLCEKIKQENVIDSIDIVAAIADAIAGAAIGVPPFVISTLIFKLGARKFCNCGG